MAAQEFVEFGALFFHAVLAFVFLAQQLFEAVPLGVVYYLVAEDERQLCLVLDLRHQSHVDKHHALRCGEGVDIGAEHGVEPKLFPQVGMVGEQRVGDAFHHAGYGVAVEYASAGHHLADIVGRLLKVAFVAHFASDIVAGAVEVAAKQFLVGLFQVVR